MHFDLAVVDGPNFFNRVGFLLERALDDRLRDEIKPYLLDWFDLDRMLAWHLQGTPALGISIVHSARPLGRGPYRLDVGEARKFWRRQASLPGCRARPIDIAKDEQEVHEGECPKCREHVEVRSTREKGVDVAVASELFATGQWSTAALVSTDTDLAPAVDALARLNRRVVCLGTSAAMPTALHVQAMDFRDLDPTWLHADIAAYRLARSAGVFDSLTLLLEREKLTFAFQWMSDEELSFVQSPWRVELGISRPARTHSDIVSLVEDQLDDTGLKGLFRLQERNDVTMVQAIPRGTLSDKGIERRIRSGGPQWVKAIRRRGVFELICDR